MELRGVDVRDVLLAVQTLKEVAGEVPVAPQRGEQVRTVPIRPAPVAESNANGLGGTRRESIKVRGADSVDEGARFVAVNLGVAVMSGSDMASNADPSDLLVLHYAEVYALGGRWFLERLDELERQGVMAHTFHGNVVDVVVDFANGTVVLADVLDPAHEDLVSLADFIAPARFDAGLSTAVRDYLYRCFGLAYAAALVWLARLPEDTTDGTAAREGDI